MVNENNHIAPRVRLGPIKWLSSATRASVESTVSKYTGREWRICGEKDLSEFAYHKSAIVSDGAFDVFFKYSDATEAKKQFEIELSGLRILSEQAGVLTPQPLGMVPVEKGTLLLLQALKAIDRGPDQWRQIGATLARIHQAKGEYYGFKRNGFWGPLYQDNTAASDWMTFYRERRLLPLLKTAVDSGNMPLAVVSLVEKLAVRLPDLCGPAMSPTLVHGDAQQNNFISTAEGTYVIDPAVYFGHPEMDLALIDSWQPVPRAVFDGYRREMPIDSSFDERRDLWRVPLYLAAVALEGPIHVERLINAVKTYW